MITNKPLVSIGIPVYGVEKYIERCARSLFEQTYENIEYIFIDDCTPDKSIEILKKVLDDYPLRKEVVHIIQHEHNKGLAGARNTFIEHATGEFVIHVDSDDWVDENLVEKLVSKQSDNDADVVFVNYIKVYKDHNQERNEIPFIDEKEYRDNVLLRKAFGHIWGRLIRKSLYIYNNIMCEEGINMGEDFQIYAKLLFYAQTVSFVTEHLYMYNCLNEGSYTNMYSKEKLRQDWRSFDSVKEFYLSQSADYDKLLQAAELKVIVTDLVYSARYKGIDYYYTEAINRLKSIDKDVWRTQPRSVRIMLNLHKSRPLMNLYANFATNIKHFIEKRAFKTFKH